MNPRAKRPEIYTSVTFGKIATSKMYISLNLGKEFSNYRETCNPRRIRPGFSCKAEQKLDILAMQL
jgi:hypothetical protein